jgi:hypothetical protein
MLFEGHVTFVIFVHVKAIGCCTPKMHLM